MELWRTKRKKENPKEEKSGRAEAATEYGRARKNGKLGGKRD